jgi:hypothetical protein
MKNKKASRGFDAAIKRDCAWFQSNPGEIRLRRNVTGGELPRNLRGRGIAEVAIERATPATFVRTYFDNQGRPLFSGYDAYHDQIVPLASTHPISIQHNGETIQELFVNRTDVAVTDREWFKQHPGASEFKRSSTIDEIRATLPPGADITRFAGTTTVRKVAPGIRERLVSVTTRDFRKPE